jgi:hypothetical protein
MLNNLRPWHVLLASLAGWVNQHQQRAAECHQEENRVLRQQLGTRLHRLTDGQRHRVGPMDADEAAEWPRRIEAWTG